MNCIKRNSFKQEKQGEQADEHIMITDGINKYEVRFC